MNIAEELLSKYFKGRCTPEERLLVINYLKEIEDLPEHLLNKEEWDDAIDQPITKEKSDEMFAEIKKQTNSKKLKISWLKITSAAAIILAIVTLGFFTINQNRINSIYVKNKVIKKEEIAVISWKSIVNYTNITQFLSLPDGSFVKIYPGAELRYAIPFVSIKREVYLKGKSFFQVAKDKKHPFIVYSNGLSTTALGTSFTITATEKSNTIKVELHTGKILVKNIDRTFKEFNEILMPGNELVYNKLKKEVKVAAKTTLAKELPKHNEWNFTQVPLNELLNKLQKHYKVKINYNAMDLKEISFTGKINLNQKAEIILTELTELNKLNLNNTAEGFSITK